MAFSRILVGVISCEIWFNTYFTFLICSINHWLLEIRIPWIFCACSALSDDKNLLVTGEKWKRLYAAGWYPRDIRLFPRNYIGGLPQGSRVRYGLVWLSFVFEDTICDPSWVWVRVMALDFYQHCIVPHVTRMWPLPTYRSSDTVSIYWNAAHQNCSDSF